MEKYIDSFLGLIEVLIISGVVGISGYAGLKVLHEAVRKEAIAALKKPTPSLVSFSSKLTSPTK